MRRKPIVHFERIPGDLKGHPVVGAEPLEETRPSVRGVGEPGMLLFLGFRSPLAYVHVLGVQVKPPIPWHRPSLLRPSSAGAAKWDSVHAYTCPGSRAHTPRPMWAVRRRGPLHTPQRAWLPM